MKSKKTRITITILALAAAFGLGFTFKVLVSDPQPDPAGIKRVTGIGGIFFKCKDPEKIKEWYKTHLGLETDRYGARFEWQEGPDPQKKGSMQWTPFTEGESYFEPSSKDFMINYRVENLEALVELLKMENVTLLDTIETYDYGKFVHLMDPEGNKIELYEPNPQH